jgi:hypothetical protein
LDADGETGAEGDLFERKVVIMTAGAFDEVDVGNAAGSDFLDNLGLFGRENGKKEERAVRGRGKTCDDRGGEKMRIGEVGERIE